MIILDFGSGNTCQNDFSYMKKMIDTLSEVDKDRKCIIKWQLFKEAGRNVPLDRELFCLAYGYAKHYGFKTAASIFDKESLEFFLGFEIPFVKIANRRDLDWLIGEVPRKVQVIVSVGTKIDWILKRTSINLNDKILVCVSKYPATLESYEKQFIDINLKTGVSDHTTDWTLYRKYEPEIYECHFCLEDSTGPDAGLFVRRPNQLREIL